MSFEKDFNYYYDSYKFGTYMAVNPTEETKEKIKEIIDKINPDNPIDVDDIHVTLVYSKGKGNPTYQPSRNNEYQAEASKFELFGDNNDVLVIKLDSIDLENRHDHILNAAALSSYFDVYKPHVTIAYDVESGDLPDADLLKDSDGNKLEFHFKGETIDAIRPDSSEINKGNFTRYWKF